MSLPSGSLVEVVPFCFVSFCSIAPRNLQHFPSHLLASCIGLLALFMSLCISLDLPEQHTTRLAIKPPTHTARTIRGEQYSIQSGILRRARVKEMIGTWRVGVVRKESLPP